MIPESKPIIEKKKKTVDRSGIDEDVIRNLINSLDNELSAMKTKLINME